MRLERNESPLFLNLSLFLWSKRTINANAYHKISVSWIIDWPPNEFGRPAHCVFSIIGVSVVFCQNDRTKAIGHFHQTRMGCILCSLKFSLPLRWNYFHIFPRIIVPIALCGTVDYCGENWCGMIFDLFDIEFLFLHHS